MAKCSDLDERSMEYLTFSLDALTEAAEARNKLVHGLFKAEPISGELISVYTRPVAKVPTITRGDVLKQLTDAIALCERAVGVLQSTAVAIALPEVLDDVLPPGRGKRSREKP